MDINTKQPTLEGLRQGYPSHVGTTISSGRSNDERISKTGELKLAKLDAYTGRTRRNRGRGNNNDSTDGTTNDPGVSATSEDGIGGASLNPEEEVLAACTHSAVQLALQEDYSDLQKSEQSQSLPQWPSTAPPSHRGAYSRTEGETEERRPTLSRKQLHASYPEACLNLMEEGEMNKEDPPSMGDNANDTNGNHGKAEMTADAVPDTTMIMKDREQDQDQQPLRDNNRQNDDHETCHMQNSETHLVRASLVEPPVMAEIVHQALSTPAETPPPDAAPSGRKHVCCGTAAAFLTCLALIGISVAGIVCGTGHCGGGGSQIERDDNPTKSQQEEDTTTTTADLPNEIRIYTWQINCLRMQKHVKTFYERTGIQVHIDCIEEPLYTRDQFHQEILSDAKIQTGLYDGYTLGPHLYGDLNLLDGLYDMTPLIRGRELGTIARYDFEWNDIFRFYRENGAVYDQKIVGIPIDGDVHSLYYRQDLFTKYSKLPPATWEEYTELAKFFHGREEMIPGSNKNDTVTISGSCVGKLERTEFWVFLILSSMTQYAGTSWGNLFDPNTMEPLLGEAFVKTLQFIEEQYVYGADNEYEGTFHEVNINRMNEGRCAMTYMWGDAYTEAAKAPPTSLIAGYLGTAQTPGSKWYLNRDTQRLQKCVKETCSCGNEHFPGHQDDDDCINSAPFAAYTGWAGACSNYVEDTRKRACAEFMGYISSPELSVGDTIPNTTVGAPFLSVDPFRKSQTVLRSWTDRGLPEESTRTYLDTVQTSLGSPNVALDMRIPGSADFQSSMNAIFRAHLTKLKEKEDSGLEGEDLLMTEEERWEVERDIRDQWKKLIREYDHLHSPPLLDAYKRNLGGL